jgi:hypothetical protein
MDPGLRRDDGEEAFARNDGEEAFAGMTARRASLDAR